MNAPRVISVSGNPKTDEPSIREAAAVLREGGLIIMPTDTVYGLAADPSVAGAEKRLYAVKQRAENKPISWLVADVGQIEKEGARLSRRGMQLAGRYWPGPLTLVLKTRRGYEGFRIPDHAVALAVLRAAGHGLRVTSANLSGDPPACTAAEAVAALGPAVAVVLDAGPAPGGVPSTVIRIIDDRVEVIREGAIAGDEIMNLGWEE